MSDPLIGQEAWKSRRKEWTTANHDPPPSTSASPLERMNDDQKNSVYHSLITERRSFTRPIPLSAVVGIVVHGWKKNGTWPDVPV